MPEVKKVIDQHAREIAKLLQQVGAKAEEITRLYTHVDSAGSIEKAELIRMIQLCENVILDDVPSWRANFERITFPRIEGWLNLGKNGRYCLGDHEFTSGSSIELFVADELQDDYGWNFGRIEHRDDMGGYYFFNVSGYNHYQLAPGMLAAIRTKTY